MKKYFRGRKLFSMVYPLIKIFTFIFSFLPQAILDMFWVWSNLLPELVGAGLRYAIARARCQSLGRNVYFGRFVIIKNWHNLVVGDNVSIHPFSYLDALGGIEIGDNVSIAHSSSVISFNHVFIGGGLDFKSNGLISEKLYIGNNVWVGCGVRILMGAKIESDLVIAAGAVVLSELKSGYIYGGVPARSIKEC